jgi:hypothetical protein
MRQVVGFLMAAIALFAFATAIVPRWRRSVFWKGSCVRCGPIASLGFGLVFGSVAVLLVANESLADQHNAWFVLSLLAGLIMVFAGQALDFKRRGPKNSQ